MGLNKKSLDCDDNIFSSRVNDRIKQINTATVCKVISVNTSDKTVCVQPLVQMSDLKNNPITHGVVNNIPYIRLQGGSYGIICDPVVGDIGLVVFCSRDISNVIKNKAITTAGSKRINSISDGIYVASLLLDDPETYLKIEKEKISIKSKDLNVNNETTEINSLATISVVSQAVTITAPAISIMSEAVTVTGIVTAQDFMTTDGVSLNAHIHGNGNDGNNTTGPVSG